MLRSFGLEPTDLVTSYPTWKVPKGSRSTSRRGKKTIRKGLKDCTELINRTPVSGNMPVSGSEKRGSPMLDCGFSEKEVHVPIKKRRFLLRSSPSPPPPPPVVLTKCTEESGGHTKSHDVSNKHSDLDCSTSDISSTKNVDCTVSLEDKKSEEANKGFIEGEDFCGISILAAAACSSSLGADSTDTKDGLGFEEASVQAHELPPISETVLSSSRLSNEDLPNSSEMPTGETVSSVGLEPVGEPASVSATVDLSQDVTATKGAVEPSSKDPPSTLLCDVSCSSTDVERAGSPKQSCRDGRFHWDLNVVMDAWEDPFEESPVEENDVPSQDAGKNSHDDNLENKVHDFEFKLTTRCATQDSVLPGESETLANERSEENKMKIDFNHCNYVLQPTKLEEGSLVSNCDKNMEMVSNDSKFLCGSRISKPPDGLVDTALDPATYVSASGTKNEDVDVRCLNLGASGSNCLLENVKSSYASDDMQRSLGVSSSSDIGAGVKSDTTIRGFMKTSHELQPDRTAVAENDGIKSAEFPERHNVTSSGNNLSHSSSCVEGPNSASTKCAAPKGAKEQDIGGNKGEKLVCSDTSSLSKETCDKSSSCLVDAAEALNQDSNAKIELRKGYDCQYEDGEVREATNEHLWDGSDVVDREVEYVDYESDDMEPCTINPAGYLVSGSGVIMERDSYGVQETAVGSSSVSNVDNEAGGEATELVEDFVSREEESRVKLHSQFEENLKEPVVKEPLVGRSSSSSDMDIAVSDEGGEKGRLVSHASELVDSKCAEKTSVEPKPFRRNLQSRIGGSVAHDMSSREERLNRLESRYDESSSIRSFERPRYYFQNQGRGRQADSWDSFPDSRRGIRRRYSPIMHRLSTRLEDDANMDTDNGGGYTDVQNDAPSYSHQLVEKNRSGDHNEEDDYAAGVHSRYRPTRTFSPGRPSTYGRGRSIRFNNSYVENRGGRGRYNNAGPSPDERFQSSLKYRRPLSYRERSMSPFGGRGHPSRGKSPSQSRSRSPIMWNHSPRGRSGPGSSFIRQNRSSRSPNFGSEVRIHQRLRSTHHQQTGFGPDDADGGFRAIPRNRGSPPPGHHFREFSYNQRPGGGLERSPGRIRTRGDRAGVYDPPRNLKYHRISEESSSRDHIRYDEESYDGRRKHYGPALRAPVRHNNSYEDSSMDGRLQQHRDMNDSFSMPKRVRDNRDGSEFPGRGLRGSSMDNRMSDLPRRFRGEHSYVCEQEDQYRSSPSHGGRFENMDGVNRGRRYDYFDNNRRKQYDPPSFMKRNSDSDGSEKRLNHNLDENFQGGPQFCGRPPMRSFDGRLSARLREEMNSTGCGQERKLEDNPQ